MWGGSLPLAAGVLRLAAGPGAWGPGSLRPASGPGLGVRRGLALLVGALCSSSLSFRVPAWFRVLGLDFVCLLWYAVGVFGCPRVLLVLVSVGPVGSGGVLWLFPRLWSRSAGGSPGCPGVSALVCVWGLAGSRARRACGLWPRHVVCPGAWSGLPGGCRFSGGRRRLCWPARPSPPGRLFVGLWPCGPWPNVVCFGAGRVSPGRPGVLCVCRRSSLARSRSPVPARVSVRRASVARRRPWSCGRLSRWPVWFVRRLLCALPARLLGRSRPSWRGVACSSCCCCGGGCLKMRLLFGRRGRVRRFGGRRAHLRRFRSWCCGALGPSSVPWCCRSQSSLRGRSEVVWRRWSLFCALVLSLA